MKIKLDENLSCHLKDFLHSLGHDVKTTYEEGLTGKEDNLVAAVAQKEERMLLSLDKEFADLRKYPPGSHPGIIIFRPKQLGPGTVIPLIQKFMREVNLEEFQRYIVVVDQERIRVRKP